MLTDLVQIKRLGDKQRDENLRLRMHLKRREHNERRLIKIAQQVEEEIDCLECANCCRVATAKVTDRDVEKLAKHFSMTPGKFKAQYTEPNEEEGRILKRTESGCVFLDGNYCTVYESRPQSCDLFPHMAKGPGSLVSRMWEMPDRASYCPIVYNTLELWKDEVGFQR